MNSTEALNEWAARKLASANIDYTEITSVEEKTLYGGYCETCAYDYQAMVITYKALNGHSKSYETSSKFSDILDELFAIADEGRK